MCLTNGDHLLKTIAEEEKVAKELGWFRIKYFGATRARYVFVNAERYGLVWTNVVFFLLLHVYYAYGMYQLFAQKLWAPWIFVYWYGWISGVGTTVGAHRLYSHRTYTASLPLRIFLVLLHTMAGQNDMATWVRDHRLHHKYTETDADPHNSRRGAFFSHVGWLLTKKHPDVLVKGRTISNADILADPVIYYQKKYYLPLYLFFRLAFPIWILMHFFQITFGLACIGVFSMYITSLHITWFVNSAAHIFGDRPYNGKIQPRENPFVNWITLGEGFHNFHHTFPWDYGIAELGWEFYDPAKNFIELMAFLGLATNLKKASPELVRRTRERMGTSQGMSNNNDALKAKSSKVLQSHRDSMFYVLDHPYNEPHPYLDDNNHEEAVQGKSI